MKLVYIHQYFNTPDMSGSTRSYEIAKRIVEAGHEVHIVTTDRVSSKCQKGWRHELVDGINVHWLSVPYSNNMSFYKRLVAFIRFALYAGSKATALKGHLVFASSTPLTVAIPAVIASKRLRVPMVFEVRDLWPDVPIEMGIINSPILKFLSRKLERFAYNNSSHIVALSPDMAKGIIEKGYPKSKVSMIPNSCDNDVFEVSASRGEAFRLKHGISLESPLVLYAGTLGVVNGVTYLVEIAAHFMTIDSNVKFLVIGDGIEFNRVLALAKEEGVLNNNFFLLSSISKREIANALSASTVCTSLVINNRVLWANSANKVFDAMAASRPIVINHGGWLKDCVEDNEIGLVICEDDSLTAANQLFEFIKDKNKLDLASRNAHALSINDFSRDHLTQSLISILNSTLEESKESAD